MGPDFGFASDLLRQHAGIYGGGAGGGGGPAAAVGSLLPKRAPSSSSSSSATPSSFASGRQGSKIPQPASLLARLHPPPSAAAPVPPMQPPAGVQLQALAGTQLLESIDSFFSGAQLKDAGGGVAGQASGSGSAASPSLALTSSGAGGGGVPASGEPSAAGAFTRYLEAAKRANEQAAAATARLESIKAAMRKL